MKYLFERANYRVNSFIENNWFLFLVMVAGLTVAFMMGMGAWL